MGRKWRLCNLQIFPSRFAEKTISLDAENEWYPNNWKPKTDDFKIQPAFYKFKFEADKIADTFLNMEKTPLLYLKQNKESGILSA